jgi:hypothetical protein
MICDDCLPHQRGTRSFNIKHHTKTHFDDEPIKMEFFNLSRKEEYLISHQCLHKTDRSFLFGISNN